MNISSSWPKTDARWYLGVRCRKCRTPILFALDHTEGTGQSAPVSTGKLVLTCAVEDCKYQGDYTAAAVSRFQKQPAPPVKAAKKQEGKEGKEGKEEKEDRKPRRRS